MTEQHAVPLHRNRDFSVFWVGQTLSQLGSSFSLIALPLLVLDATGSVLQMGLLTAVAGVASLCTGVLAGVWVDRVDRRRLMIGCDVLNAVLFALVPLAWTFGRQVWLLYVVMGASAVAGMIFRVAYVTAVPALVGTQRVTEANSRLETSNAVASIGGPVLAGVVSAVLSPQAAIGVDAATFALSAVALLLVRLSTPARPEQERLTWRAVRTDFAVGFGFLWRTPVLRWLALLLTVISALSLGMTDVFIFQLRDGLGQGDAVVGAVMAMAGVGTVLAAVLLPVLRRRLGFGICWLGSYVLCAAAVAAVAWSSSPVAVAVPVLGYSFGMALAGISSMSLRQTVTPEHLLGRVTAAFWTGHTALAPLGAAALTALVEAAGVRVPLLVATVVLLGVVAVGLFTPINQRNPDLGETTP